MSQSWLVRLQVARKVKRARRAASARAATEGVRVDRLSKVIVSSDRPPCTASGQATLLLQPRSKRCSSIIAKELSVFETCETDTFTLRIGLFTYGE